MAHRKLGLSRIHSTSSGLGGGGEREIGEGCRERGGEGDWKNTEEG